MIASVFVDAGVAEEDAADVAADADSFTTVVICSSRISTGMAISFKIQATYRETSDDKRENF